MGDDGQRGVRRPLRRTGDLDRPLGHPGEVDLTDPLVDRRAAVDGDRHEVRWPAAADVDDHRRALRKGDLALRVTEAGEALLGAVRPVEPGRQVQRAGALVDDVGLEVAGDPAAGADADQQVAYPGAHREPLGALRGDEEADLGEVDASPRFVEAELGEHVGRGRAVGQVEHCAAEPEADGATGTDEGVRRFHGDELGDARVAGIVEPAGAEAEQLEVDRGVL